MIDRKVVEKVAALARLDLLEAEKDSMAHDMAAIISYVEQLSSVDTEGVEPTAFLVPAHDPMRDDVPTTSTNRSDSLANGPRVKGAFFAVPKVIG